MRSDLVSPFPTVTMSGFIMLHYVTAGSLSVSNIGAGYSDVANCDWSIHSYSG